MPTSTEAEEHLRVIRSLMERATIYRAISAPAALLGGTVSVAVASVAWWISERGSMGAGLPFAPTWLSVLAFTCLANLWLLRRDALRRGEKFVSPGMRLALRAMLPAMLAGGLCVFLKDVGGAPMLVTLWLLFYGVSLLAAAHFAPASIRLLGRIFFSTGSALLIGLAFILGWRPGSNPELIAHLLMGATFGVFHLVYAACTWPRRTGGGV